MHGAASCVLHLRCSLRFDGRAIDLGARRVRACDGSARAAGAC